MKKSCIGRRKHGRRVAHVEHMGGRGQRELVMRAHLTYYTLEQKLHKRFKIGNIQRPPVGTVQHAFQMMPFGVRVGDLGESKKAGA